MWLVANGWSGSLRQYPDGAVLDGPLRVATAVGPSAQEVMGLPSPKTMYRQQSPPSQLRQRLETLWLPGTLSMVGLGAGDLPPPVGHRPHDRPHL